MKKRSIFFFGIFLIAVGSISLAFGLWYAYTNGISPNLSISDILLPELSGNLLWLISVSCSTIVLGIIFLLWAYKLKND